MGVYRPFIKGVRTAGEFQEQDHSNDKPFTLADTLTVSRPVLAAIAAKMLIKGERPVFPVVAAAAATDMEGIPARLIDKLWPGSGWGTTKHGAEWDPIADSAALLLIGAATLKAPRVSVPGKMAMASVLGVEGYKANWAWHQNRYYRRVMGEKLVLPPSLEGKEAMAEKLTAAALAVATNDVDNPVLRGALGAGAMAFAGVGSVRGDRARRAYEPVIDELIDNYTADFEAGLIGLPTQPVMLQTDHIIDLRGL